MMKIRVKYACYQSVRVKGLLNNLMINLEGVKGGWS